MRILQIQPVVKVNVSHIVMHEQGLLLKGKNFELSSPGERDALKHPVTLSLLVLL